MSERSHNDSERDARLTAIYRAAADDAPPRALDAAILAAARREVGARPRPAGFAFSNSWRTSLSIAAVLVLSVSLVTLLREEAPELVAPPRADAPAADSKLKSMAGADDKISPADSGLARGEQRSKNIGLKPPQPASPSGLGMRQPEFAQGFPQSKKDTGVDKAEADAIAPADLAKRRAETSVVAAARENRIAAAAEQQRQTPRPDAQRDVAQAPAAPSRAEAVRPAPAAEPVNAPAPATTAGSIAGVGDSKSQIKTDPARADRAESESRTRAQEYAPAKQAAQVPPAEVAAGRPAAPPRPAAAPMVSPPQAKPAPPPAAVSKLERPAELPPEKWLERIEDLRRQGRLDEAKTSLAEFRKRYPDYRLPDNLKDWAKP